MVTTIGEDGLLIPRELLEGMTEVKIIRQEGMIIIVPAPAEDPILEFGRNPIKLGVTDASENLDRYLSGAI